mgnify:CR=1 FL=1
MIEPPTSDKVTADNTVVPSVPVTLPSCHLVTVL